MDVYPRAPENKMMGSQPLCLAVLRGWAMGMSSFNFGDHANSTFNYALLANHNYGFGDVGSTTLQGEDGLLLRTVDDPDMVHRVLSLVFPLSRCLQLHLRQVDLFLCHYLRAILELTPPQLSVGAWAKQFRRLVDPC
jgi:hypothetical protein